MAETIRVGRISALNYEAGTARVVYTDRDKEVTRELPLFSDEYHMPKVDDLVFVAHMDNGAESAIILGKYWNKKNVPPESGKDLYRKDFDHAPGRAFVRYHDDTSTLEIQCVGTISITAPFGDVNVNGISLVHHTHPFSWTDAAGSGDSDQPQ